MGNHEALSADQAVNRHPVLKRMVAAGMMIGSLVGVGDSAVEANDTSALESLDVNGVSELYSGKVDANGVVRLDFDAPNVAITGNITSVEPEAPGFFTVYPCNTGRPNTSNLNFDAGGATANGFVIPTDSNGELCVYTSVKSHVLADISGISTPQAKEDLGLKKPDRVEDTRSGAKVDANGVVRLDFDAPNVAITGNITSVEPEAPGFFTVYPCNTGRPNTSNLNFDAGGATANGFVIPTDSNGELCVYTSVKSHVLADISGISTPQAKEDLGLKKPDRVEDTRSGAKVDANGVVRLDFDAPNVAITGNITSVEPEAPGFFTVYPCNTGRPNTSNLNFDAGGATANGFVIPTDSNGELCVYTSVKSHVLADISGISTPQAKEDLGLKKPDRVEDTRQEEVSPPTPPTPPNDLTPEQYAELYNLGVNEFWPPIEVIVPWTGERGYLDRIDAFAFSINSSFCNVIIDPTGDDTQTIDRVYAPLSECPFLDFISK